MRRSGKPRGSRKPRLRRQYESAAGSPHVRTEKEHRVGGAFVRRLHRPCVLGLTTFRAQRLEATSTYGGPCSVRHGTYAIFPTLNRPQACV